MPMDVAREELPDLLCVPQKKRNVVLRVLFAVLAGVCFAAGMVGWLVPLVTGIPFYVAGFVFLALASDRARAWANRLERRLPGSWRRGLRRALAKVPSRRLRECLNLPPPAAGNGTPRTLSTGS